MDRRFHPAGRGGVGRGRVPKHRSPDTEDTQRPAGGRVGIPAAVVALVDLTQDDGTTWTTSTLVAVMILLLTRHR